MALNGLCEGRKGMILTLRGWQMIISAMAQTENMRVFSPLQGANGQ